MLSRNQLKKNIKSHRAKAEQWQNEIKKKLIQMLGVGDRRSLPGGNPTGRWSGSAGDGSGNTTFGGVNFQSGVMPNDQQVSQYIQSIGGNPYSAKAQQSGVQLQAAKTRTITSSPNVALKAKQHIEAQVKQQKEEEKSQLDAFLQDAQEQHDRANASNEARYSDILGRLEGSRARNMERVENWGASNEARLEKGFKEKFREIKGNLKERGLGNSTIIEAFRERNELDLKYAQLELGYRIDDRSAKYDQKLTGDIARFMEARTDQAPDYGQMATLAQQYGLSGDGEGFGGPQEYVPPQGQGVTATSQQIAPQQAAYQAPQQPMIGYSAGAAGKMADGMQQPNYAGVTGQVPSMFSWEVKPPPSYLGADPEEMAVRKATVDANRLLE